MVIITGVLLVQQSRFDSSTLLRSLTYSVALSVRQAQFYGASVLGTTTPTTCAGGSSSSGVCYASAYGVYYNSATPGSYALFADLHPGDYSLATIGGEVLKTFTFGTGYSIVEFCALVSGTLQKDCTGIDDSNGSPTITSLSVLYKRPNFDAAFVAYDTSGNKITNKAYTGAYLRLQGGNGTGDYRSVSITSTGLIAVQPPNTAPGGINLPACSPNWSCGAWGSCVGGTQTCAAYQDSNNCGTSYLGSPMTQACTLCGNGTIDSGEQCDGANLGGGSCTSLGYTGGGTLSCSASCQYNTSQCVQITLTNGLIAYWKLDDGSGTNAVDSMGFSNGTLSGSPTWTTGKINGGVSFSGSSQYVDFGTKFPAITSAITISAWVNPGASQIQYADIWGDHESSFKGMVMQQNSNTLNQYSWGYGNGSNFSSGAGFFNLTASTWTHVVAVKDATTCYVYLNGVEQVALRGSCSSAIVPATTINFSAGRGYAGGGRFFNGKVDEVAVWNRALSASEVSQLYNSGAGRQYPFSP